MEGHFGITEAIFASASKRFPKLRLSSRWNFSPCEEELWDIVVLRPQPQKRQEM